MQTTINYETYEITENDLFVGMWVASDTCSGPFGIITDLRDGEFYHPSTGEKSVEKVFSVSYMDSSECIFRGNSDISEFGLVGVSFNN